jgi:hypothetical protein
MMKGLRLNSRVNQRVLIRKDFINFQTSIVNHHKEQSMLKVRFFLNEPNGKP